MTEIDPMEKDFEIPEPNNFKVISESYKKNIFSILVLNNEIGMHADEHDSKVLQELLNHIERTIETSTNLEKDSKLISPPHSLTTPEIETTHQSKKKPKEFHVTFDSFEEAEDFRQVLKSFTKQTANQGLLLRKSALTILVSHFELLISDLLKEYFRRYPSALPSEDRTISLSELKILGSIDEAMNYIICLEVENVLRKSTKEQFEYFSKRLKIDFTPINHFMESIIEITQRRNLIVHNGGIVNKIYLNQVSNEMITFYKAVENTQLNVSKNYLSESINIFNIVGIVLIQQCWRKWENDQIDLSDSVLMEIIFDSLIEKEYEIVIQLAKYASTISLASDVNARIIAINHSIAHKELNQFQEMENVLSKFDWTSCANKFHVALNILRDKEELTYILLEKALSTNEITYHDLLNWPLFRMIRNTVRFQELIVDKRPN